FHLGNATACRDRRMKKTAEILLVDDNPADVDLTIETLAQSARALHVSAVSDGGEAMSWLRRQGRHRDAPQPDLVILDLNLPRKSGREVLAEIKTDSELRRIPIIVFTSSEAASDVTHSYDLGANSISGNRAILPILLPSSSSWSGSGSTAQPSRKRRNDDRPIHPRAVDRR